MRQFGAGVGGPPAEREGAPAAKTLARLRLPRSAAAVLATVIAMGERTAGNGHDVPTFLAEGGSDHGEIAFRGHGGRRPRVLAHGGRGWKRLVQDAGCLYWADSAEGTITRLPKDGGIPLELASGQQAPAGLAIADGFLYWTNQWAGTVVRMAAGGGEIETLAEGQDNPGPIAVAGVDVVWGNLGNNLSGALMKGGTDGRAPIKIASKQKLLRSIALDEQTIYWTNHGTKRPDYFQNGSVMKMPRALPPAGEKRKRQVVARPQTGAEGIAVDEGWVYWTSFGLLDKSFCDGAVMRREKRGGTPTAVATGARGATSLAIDATHVYWCEAFESAIRRAPKGGGAAETVVDTEVRTLMPHAVMVDERFVYWTVHDSRRAGGAVWKMAK